MDFEKQLLQQNFIKDTDNDFEQEKSDQNNNEIKDSRESPELNNASIKTSICSSIQMSEEENNSESELSVQNEIFQYLMPNNILDNSSNEKKENDFIDINETSNLLIEPEKNVIQKKMESEHFIEIEKKDKDIKQINIDDKKDKKQGLYNFPQGEKEFQKEFSSNPPFSKIYLNVQKCNQKNNSFSKNIILYHFTDKEMTKLLQKMLIEADKETINNIFNELRGVYKYLIRNKNGNYFLCDLFKLCNQTQRILVLKEITNTISDNCLDKFANHPIQVLIDYSSCQEEYNLILNSFDYNKLLIASIDPKGSFVLQRIIKHIPENYRKKFNLLFIMIFCFISTKKFGVVNCKAFLENTKNEEMLDGVINLIRANFLNIAKNEYGNYLIQYIYKKWHNSKFGLKIKERIITYFKILYENKYSYFICDLFLKYATDEEKKYLINILITNNSINNKCNDNNDKNIIAKIVGSFAHNKSKTSKK